MCGTKSGTVCGYAACTTTVLYVPEKKPVKSSTRKTLTQIRVINNPDASVGVCCSHKVVAVGFNTLRYDASVGVLNPPHE